VPIWALVLGCLSVTFVYVSLLAIDFTLGLLLPGCLVLKPSPELCEMLTFVLGDRFEGAAEFALRRLRQGDARGVADGSRASRRFRIAVSLACNHELVHVT